jgi:hypothetical protein
MPSRHTAPIVAAQLLTASLALAQATTRPVVEVQIDGQSFPVPVTSLDGKTYVIGADGSGAIIESAAALVILTGTLDPDPSINYGLSVTDFGAPSNFVLLFSTPIVPTGVPNDVFSSLVGGLTDSTGTDGVSLVPFGGPLVQVASLGLPATNMGVDIGSAVSDPATGFPSSTSVYGPFSAGPIPGPGPGPWTTLTVTTSFTFSGNGDIAALTGSATIIPIPSPALASPAALFLLSHLRRRRRR